MLRRCCEALITNLNGAFVHLDGRRTSERAGAAGQRGMYTHTDGAHARVPIGKFKIGQIAEERRPRFDERRGR